MNLSFFYVLQAQTLMNFDTPHSHTMYARLQANRCQKNKEEEEERDEKEKKNNSSTDSLALNHCQYARTTRENVLLLTAA